MTHGETFTIILGIVAVIYWCIFFAIDARRFRMSYQNIEPEDEGQKMLLINTMDALDQTVGDGQLVFQGVQRQEDLIQGAFPVVTIIPVDGEAFTAAIQPSIFALLNHLSGRTA